MCLFFFSLTGNRISVQTSIYICSSYTIHTSHGVHLWSEMKQCGILEKSLSRAAIYYRPKFLYFWRLNLFTTYICAAYRDTADMYCICVVYLLYQCTHKEIVELVTATYTYDICNFISVHGKGESEIVRKWTTWMVPAQFIPKHSILT